MGRLGGWIFFCVLAVAALSGWTANEDKPVKVPESGRWEKDLQRFEQEDRDHPSETGNVVFTGSSTIRIWDLVRDFPEWRAVNRGFGGSTYEELADGAPRIFAAQHPRWVVTYSGDNDIAAGQSPDEVFAHFSRFAEWLHANRPETRLLILSIKPSPKRIKLYAKMDQLNERVRAWAKGNPWTVFVDTKPVMFGPDGQPKTDYFQADGLHMTAACYQIWANLVKNEVK